MLQSLAGPAIANLRVAKTWGLQNGHDNPIKEIIEAKKELQKADIILTKDLTLKNSKYVNITNDCIPLHQIWFDSKRIRSLSRQDNFLKNDLGCNLLLKQWEILSHLLSFDNSDESAKVSFEIIIIELFFSHSNDSKTVLLEQLPKREFEKQKLKRNFSMHYLTKKWAVCNVSLINNCFD